MTAPVDTDLKFFHCEERSSLSTNGGYLSTTEIVTGSLNNVWPHVLREERVAGQTLYRKLALKVHQDDSEGYLASAEFCLDGPTLGEDRMRLFASTAAATQADITGSERFYSAGVLASAITAGASTIVINFKDASDAAGFQVGDAIRLTDKLTPSSTSGNTEYHEVATRSLSGTQLTVTTVDPIANSYTAYNTTTYAGGKVGSILAMGAVQAAAGALSWTRTGSIDYDEETYPLVFNNMGADEQQLTVTFTDDAGSFTVESDRFGTLATGSTGANYSVLHDYWAKSMFLFDAAGWSGTPVAGDEFTVQLHAAACYVWEQRIVPAGCAPLTSNKIILVNRSEGV